MPYEKFPFPETDEEGDPVISGRPHEYEWTRDIPANCACTWEWNPAARAYDLTNYGYGCPWHAQDGA